MLDAHAAAAGRAARPSGRPGSPGLVAEDRDRARAEQVARAPRPARPAAARGRARAPARPGPRAAKAEMRRCMRLAQQRVAALDQHRLVADERAARGERAAHAAADSHARVAGATAPVAAVADRVADRVRRRRSRPGSSPRSTPAARSGLEVVEQDRPVGHREQMRGHGQAASASGPVVGCSAGEDQRLGDLHTGINAAHAPNNRDGSDRWVEKRMRRRAPLFGSPCGSARRPWARCVRDGTARPRSRSSSATRGRARCGAAACAPRASRWRGAGEDARRSRSWRPRATRPRGVTQSRRRSRSRPPARGSS